MKWYHVWVTMYNRKEQYEIVQHIRCKDNETKRINCPFCGGKYTLTVTKRDGSLIWNCYKASCSASGGKRVGYGLDAIKNKFAGKTTDKTGIRTYPIPNVNAAVENHEHVLDYIQANNCTKALEDDAVKMSYDPEKDRVLFWMNNNQGAVGRALKTNIKPKWLSYGDTTGILAVGNSDTAIVVEDAASACAVYATGVYTGVALLGTNVSPAQRIQLRHYKKLIICLDKDASKKAISISRSLNGYVDTTVCFIREDFKYMSPTSIMETVNESTRISSH